MARKEKLLPGMRHKDNQRIEYRFYVGKDRYSVRGKTVKECLNKELEKIREIEEGTYKPGKDLTVAEYMDQWLESMEDQVKPSTTRTRGKLKNRMIRQPIDKAGHLFGNVKLSDLEKGHIRQMQKSLVDDGLHTRTANETLSLLKQALQDALYDELIKKNPAKAVKPLPQKEEPARDNIHRALTREEVDSFLKAAAESWYYFLYIFLLNTGLRIGEASALSIRDVTESLITVHKTVTREGIGYIIREQTKTEAGRRTVTTRPRAWEAFQGQRHLNEMLYGSKVINMSNPVFTLPKGGIIRPDRVNSDIKRICEKAGVDYFTCHAFRATFISRCIAAGVPVKTLMEEVGHKDVQMTLGLYGHGEEQQKREQILAVNV